MMRSSFSPTYMEREPRWHKGLPPCTSLASVWRMVTRFYLEDSLRLSAEAGEHNFISKVVNVLTEAGHSIEYREKATDPIGAVTAHDGFSMFHMNGPTHKRALTFRRNYYYPFWQIEPSARRWEWAVAKARFDLKAVEMKEARRFSSYWRKRLFGGAAERTSKEEFVYVPLQGRLQRQRSFQSCSPLEMIEAVLSHDPHRRVYASLHPKENYAPAELEALEDMRAKNHRLEVINGQGEALLAGCDYVATQNSSVGFAGYFFGKPCLLFAQIDFHHIAASVPLMGMDEAFGLVTEMKPKYEAYIWWFLQKMSINAGREDAEEKIAERLRTAGWVS